MSQGVIDGRPTAGRRFQPFFVAVCIDTRDRAGKRIEAVANAAGVNSKSIDRFEKGQTWTTANLERFAAAYAEVGGLEDGRKIFQRATDWWLHHGARPLTADEEAAAEPEDAPTMRMIERIRQAGERERARDETAQRPTSTRKRRSTGE